MGAVFKTFSVLDGMTSSRKLKCQVERGQYHVSDANEIYVWRRQESIISQSEQGGLRLSVESIWSDTLMMDECSTRQSDRDVAQWNSRQRKYHE